MSRRCPNCGQRLLDDELQCWQCGAQLAPPAAKAATSFAEEDAPAVDRRALTIYGALTLFILVLALLLTSFLGKQPRNRLPLADLPAGWRLVTDQARHVALYLPADWQILGSDPEQLAPLLAGQQRYEAALAPLGAAVEDEEIRLLAADARGAAFVVVAHSAVLNRLTPAEAVALLGGEGGDERVLEARQLQSGGVTQAEFLVAPDGGANEQCRQRFLPGGEAALLFALCASDNGLDGETADGILSSIQRLR